MSRMRFCGWIALALTVASCLPVTQAAAQGPQWAFRVSFSDKAGSPALSAASSFLTSRSLARRNRLGIAVDDADRPVSQLYIDSVLQLSGGVLHCTSRWLNSAVFLLSDSAKIGLVAAKSWVSSVRVVGYYPTPLHNRPAGDPKQDAEVSPLSALWKTTGTSAYYGNTWTQTALVKGDELHDAGFRGEGVLIAVLDEGFEELNSHPGFALMRASNRLVDSFQFVKRSRLGVSTGSYHGTQVLSTMAGLIPNTYVGAAPNAQYAVYATEDGSGEQPIELDNMAAAMERADSIGADIVHASLGYNTFNYPPNASLLFSQLDGKTTVAAKAANMAVSRGMLVVTTSGNEGDNSWMRLLTPGDADSALTVGNVSASRVPASNSGYGPNAAGVVKPEVATLGQGAAIFGVNGSLSVGSGTSYAAPQIAGFAACLWQSRPTLRPGRIKDAIARSAHHYTVPAAQDGYGVPDFSIARASLSVNGPVKQASALMLLSNPFDDRIQLRVNLQKSTDVEGVLTDAAGRTLFSISTPVGGGLQELSWAVPHSLPTGIYFLKLHAGSEQKTVRVLRR